MTPRPGRRSAAGLPGWCTCGPTEIDDRVVTRFWRAIAWELDLSSAIERHDVPGRPDLLADSWVRFRVGQNFAGRSPSDVESAG
jgi:hypothetical protein